MKTARIQLTVQGVKDESALAAYLATVREELGKHGTVTMSPLRTSGSLDIAGGPYVDRVEVVRNPRDAARAAAHAKRDERRAERAKARASAAATPPVGAETAPETAATVEPKA